MLSNSAKSALLLALAVAACSHAAPVATTPAPAPKPASAAASPATPATPPTSTRVVPAPLPAAPPAPTDTDKAGLPDNWQLLDEGIDHIAGISSERAMKELLAGKPPRRTVLVAVIDGGVDTAHADLKANLWSNPRETASNKTDDDKNGYVDDVHGWNFIGGRDGKNVNFDTFEATRIYANCRRKAPNGTFTELPPGEQTLCTRAAADYNKQRQEMSAQMAGIQQADQVVTAVTAALKAALKTDSLTDAQVAKLQPTTPELTRAKTTYMQLAAQGITRAVIDDAKKEVQGRLDFGLETAFNPRPVVGDDSTNISERGYGNADVMGPDAKHGTHVSGIIGAIRGNSTGIDGIASSVKIMMVRTIPNGDERDKDVANAIRYAVDNGANVINMSFGKSFSPSKAVVDAAVKYADSKGVLMVHAAGNDGANIDSVQNFPNPHYLDGGRAQNWIEVGASSWKGGGDLAAEFSNFGHTEVDLFAPGADILSTIPGGKYERDSGTSMAAPVVTGVAALVMSYYPELTAADIKRVLLNSVTRHPDELVARPGSEKDEKVPFGSLSATGGVVNAYSALKMAAQMVGRQ